MSFSAAQHVGRVQYQIWDIICDTWSRLSNLPGYTSWAQIGLLLKKGQLESKSQQSVFSVLQFLLHWMSVMSCTAWVTLQKREKDLISPLKGFWRDPLSDKGAAIKDVYMILINSVSGAEKKIVNFMWMS